MRLSVCIIHWRTREDLRSCLEALRAHPFTGGDTEVIVHDNASADGTVEMAAKDFPEVRLQVSATNLCYAEGTNAAVAASNGDTLLLLNPDARVRAGALDAMVAASEGLSRLVAPKLVWPDGRTQASVRGFPTPAATLAEMCGLARLVPACDTWRLRRFDYETPGPAPQPMASAWLIPRRAWDDVGPMDAAFPLYFNDVDWALRAAAKGWETHYAPDAVVVHDHGGTTGRVRKVALLESRRAFVRYWRKHCPRDPWLPLAAALLTLEVGARTGRWGQSLRGATTPESLQREFEAAT